MTQFAIKTQNEGQRNIVRDYFFKKEFTVKADYNNSDLSVFINPFHKEMLFCSNEVAYENVKDNNYTVIDFELFATILGIN